MANSKGKCRESDKGSRRRADSQERTTETGRRKDEALKLDEWQEEVLQHNGSIALRAGRQVGKSTVIAMKAGEIAIDKPNHSIMIISATERQAHLLFQKVLMYIDDNYRWQIKKGKDRPTKTRIKLKNGSIIRCLPTGLDGLGIRGYTVNLLIADEAAFIPESVWPAVTPMLATTGGNIILLSTPFGRLGYFYECFKDKNFKTWHINAEKIAESRQEPQRTFMKDHQEKEKDKMTRLQYAQEYLGEFVDELRQLFSDAVLGSSCVHSRSIAGQAKSAEYFLGVDIARMGEDAGSYEIISRIGKYQMIHVQNIVTRKKLTTETFDRIIQLNKQYNFKKIGIDAGSGSLGVGILDFLLREPTVKRKVVALNNLTRQLDHRGERKRTLLKEDMYFNLLALMEKGYLKLLNDDEVIASLRSIQYEYITGYGQRTTLKIFGAGSEGNQIDDIAEGLVRAAWLANQKHLNLQITYV